ncbi:MAG TPA: M13 family metallopeptidase [Candidatus Acidoferrales bacterium]|nr:M13 family metallopeptidase [Candidatus Acidoferrales bacterium]
MRKLLMILTVCLVTVIAFAQNAKKKTPPKASSQSDTMKQIPTLDSAALDKSVDPCVDFYQFSCGGWLKSNPIPPDQASWGRFNELAERNRAILRGILEKAASAKTRDADEQKIGDYYASCMDQAAINSKGTAVLKPIFDRIDAVKDKSELPELLAYLHHQGFNVFFGFGSTPDFKNAKEVIAEADQAGLSLPDRDYYLKTDAKSEELRKQFVQHVTNMFKLLGDSPEKASQEATVVMNIETALAKGSMDRVDRRDPEKIYHKISEQEWQALTPSLSFTQYITGIHSPTFSSLNVVAPDFFKALNSELSSTSLDDLKTYMRWHVVTEQSEYLPEAIDKENFDFYGRILTGAREQRARWKRCTAAVDGDIGEALGKVYVKKNFPPEAKARTLAMVKELEAALSKDIQGLDWMTEATKKQALIKLDAIQNKIGYPNKWRDYSALKIVRGDALGNSLRANEFEFNRQVQKIGKPFDKSEWLMTPPTVNAYYQPSENDINFPAGILQPPFYDFKADDAVNFGGIGAVIGHELTHGFDDEGRQFDAQGNLHDWWTEQDAKAFEQRAQCVVDEYNGFIAVDDVHENGKLTLGENTADNGGLRIALMALLASMSHDARVPAKLDGYTPEQRLFLGWGQIWCENQRPQAERLQALTNEHSLGRFRANGVVSNMPEFQKAWGCRAGQPMVRQNACRVW